MRPRCCTRYTKMYRLAYVTKDIWWIQDTLYLNWNHYLAQRRYARVLFSSRALEVGYIRELKSSRNQAIHRLKNNGCHPTMNAAERKHEHQKQRNTKSHEEDRPHTNNHPPRTLLLPVNSHFHYSNATDKHRQSAIDPKQHHRIPPQKIVTNTNGTVELLFDSGWRT